MENFIERDDWKEGMTWRRTGANTEQVGRRRGSRVTLRKQVSDFLSLTGSCPDWRR